MACAFELHGRDRQVFIGDLRALVLGAPRLEGVLPSASNWAKASTSRGIRACRRASFHWLWPDGSPRRLRRNTAATPLRSARITEQLLLLTQEVIAMDAQTTSGGAEFVPVMHAFSQYIEMNLIGHNVFSGYSSVKSFILGIGLWILLVFRHHNSRFHASILFQEVQQIAPTE
jgi:hypothetical protein